MKNIAIQNKAISESKIERLIQDKNLDAAAVELIKVISETASVHAHLKLRKYQNSYTIYSLDDR